ncbi:hypothetical protein GCM10008905_18000 [Clostridium malenominatum]|uniref:DUF8042 domain-containing protein n=1 Tax=Clostridium malenominatum TaxID=1539 RepID=A0ABP3U7T3_9CLOT
MREEKMETLITAKSYIDNLKDGVEKAFNYIYEGKEEKAISIMPHFAEGMEWLSQVLYLTKDVHREKINIESINETLNEVVEALENSDYTLVGDLLNYEVYPLLDEIKNKV